MNYFKIRNHIINKTQVLYITIYDNFGKDNKWSGFEIHFINEKINIKTDDKNDFINIQSILKNNGLYIEG